MTRPAPARRTVAAAFVVVCLATTVALHVTHPDALVTLLPSPNVRLTAATSREKAASTRSMATSASAAASWASRSSGAASARVTADGSACSARARKRTCDSAAVACSLSGSASRLYW